MGEVVVYLRKEKEIDMKKVIYIDKPSQEEKKQVEFTHYLDTKIGWQNALSQPKEWDKVFYLGNCDGTDMFACYNNSGMLIYKGHLNSGEY